MTLKLQRQKKQEHQELPKDSMHAEINTEADELNIQEIQHIKTPTNFYDLILRIDFLKFAYALMVMVLMSSITYSLIINPNSLKIENNGFIGLVGGVIISKFGDLGNMFFPKREKNDVTTR